LEIPKVCLPSQTREELFVEYVVCYGKILKASTIKSSRIEEGSRKGLKEPVKPQRTCRPPRISWGLRHEAYRSPLADKSATRKSLHLAPSSLFQSSEPF